MRIAVCAFSAVLLSGCSWFGGSSQSNSYSYGYGNGGGAYGCSGSAGAYGGQQASYGYGQASGYTTAYSTGGCGGAANGGGYGMGANGYGANGYGAGLRGAQGMGAQGMGAQGMGVNGQAMGANGYGPTGVGGGYGFGGANAARFGGSTYGAGTYGTGMYGAGANGATAGGGYGTVLGAAAPYGAAVGGAVAGTQYSGGQYANSQYAGGQYAGGTTTTIQGSPIYVPQPYPAYYGVGYNAGYAGGGYGYGYGFGGGMRGASASLPFGFEASIGTEFSVGGDIVGAKSAGPASGGGANPLNVSGTPAVSYADAYKKAVNYGLATSYDISPSTTVLASLGYSKAKGQNIQTGTIDDGTITEDLYAQWSDLEQYTVEGGLRQYMGGWNNGISGVRPYVGASAGFTHNNAVSLTQSSSTLMPVGSNTQNYLEAGWTPTASGVIGAEMQVGARTAIGVETGIRWRDDINSVQQQDDRWSVPLKLRGRVSF